MKSFRSVFASSRRSAFSREKAWCCFIARPTLGTITMASFRNVSRNGQPRAMRAVLVPNLMALKMVLIQRWYSPFSSASNGSPKLRSPTRSKVVKLYQRTRSTTPCSGPRAFSCRRWMRRSK